MLVGTTLVVGLAFSAVYQCLGAFSKNPWLGAALFHSFVSVVILLMLAKRRELKKLFQLAGQQPDLRPIVLYLPTMSVIAGVALAVSASAILGGTVQAAPDWYPQIAFILWVPVVEEIVFRAGFGEFFQKYAPGFWGIWFCALLFAWVHTLPSMGSILQGNVGLPLGPFLLGLICEYIRIIGRSLIPVILFHMVCNGTVVIFSLTDARWMNWLSPLYS